MERQFYDLVENAEVAHVQRGSIAAEIGISAGDRLISLNGKKILDVFDYRTREKEENILLLVESPGGELTEYEIEKDEDEELGIEFQNPLLSHCESCSNHCLFCFIDQLPPGMRESLYFKDDDSRLSFLTGNYITLTNISDEELDRIISYHLSPLNISVHATEPSLRRRLMGNRKAGELLERLKRIVAAGIRINCQFVLCPGLNDGEALERSLRDLLREVNGGLLSIALVPVGLTSWRDKNRLYPLRPYTRQEARSLLRQVERWQERFSAELGRRTLYAADEFYLLAEEDFPAAEAYEQYPQLENGVGMARLFLHEWSLPAGSQTKGLSRSVGEEYPVGKRLHIATAELGEKVLSKVKEQMEKESGLEIVIHPLTNLLFGERITVTGLLCGRDIASQLRTKIKAGDSLLLCDSMLRGDENIFLDDFTLEELAGELKCRVSACGERGEDVRCALALLGKEAGLK